MPLRDQSVFDTFGGAGRWGGTKAQCDPVFFNDSVAGGGVMQPAKIKMAQIMECLACGLIVCITIMASRRLASARCEALNPQVALAN
jgi:hypothetical protein